MTTTAVPTFADRIAEELSLTQRAVEAVLRLLAEGGTVPFIARYRKEATGGLDEVAIRSIQERDVALQELESRRSTILKSIEEQGKLTDELRRKIESCRAKTELEDLYLPYKPKRRTRAMIARERGLEPLADLLWQQPDSGDPEDAARAFIDAEKEVPDAEAALAGARDILAERVAERADVRALVRGEIAENGILVSRAAEPDKAERTKFEQYYDYSERIASIPSHRFLAIRRGEREGVLRVSIEADGDALVRRIEGAVGARKANAFGEQVCAAIRDAYKRLIFPSVETDVRVDRKLSSDADAVEVFAQNLGGLLLSPPLGGKAVIGIDPGLRTGCKCAAVDATGKFLGAITIYPTQNPDRAAKELAAFVKHFSPQALAVGNGTGGRETEAFARRALAEAELSSVLVVPVNEAGASVYSASDVAREEFPELDLTIRGAISIARRLQDPLAELVKIDPKSIGVGQYQHDVHQPLLARKLDEVVESCVNRVGVDLNTASAPLLSRVAGIGPTAAKRVVEHRDSHGAFASRAALRKVSGIGPRTFEQCAGFLRVRPSQHPLDASAVHPERYELVEQMAADLDVELPELIGNDALIDKIDIRRYVQGEVGEPTLRDILAELRKPGRDPRKHFDPPRFREDVHELEDLSVGMTLEGVVTNVTHFGAFVDVGVHTDGLVHVSQLADRFVSDPSEVVKVGDRLQVRVLEIDLERRRVALSARKEGAAPRQNAPRQSPPSKQEGRPRGGPRRPAPDSGSRDYSDQLPTTGRNNPFQKLKDRLKD